MLGMGRFREVTSSGRQFSRCFHQIRQTRQGQSDAFRQSGSGRAVLMPAPGALQPGQELGQMPLHVCRVQGLRHNQQEFPGRCERQARTPALAERRSAASRRVPSARVKVTASCGAGAARAECGDPEEETAAKAAIFAGMRAGCHSRQEL